MVVHGRYIIKVTGRCCGLSRLDSCFSYISFKSKYQVVEVLGREWAGIKSCTTRLWDS